MWNSAGRGTGSRQTKESTSADSEFNKQIWHLKVLQLYRMWNSARRGTGSKRTKAQIWQKIHEIDQFKSNIDSSRISHESWVTNGSIMGSSSHSLAKNSARDYRKEFEKTYTTKPSLAQTSARDYKKEFKNQDLAAITKPSQAENPLKLSTSSEKCLHQNTNEFWHLQMGEQWSMLE